MGQVMHNTFDTWPETVGIWEDENKNIVAVVHSQGERINRVFGEVFFQLTDKDFSNDFLNELIDFAEGTLPLTTEEGTNINFRVNEESNQIKDILKARGYTLYEFREPMSSMIIENNDFIVNLPEGFRLADGNEVSDYQKGFAHGRAFGYYKKDVPDDNDAELSYQNLRKAPDYIPELDLMVIDEKGEVAAFAGLWYDDLNKIAILEPVGTIPKYRKMGLGKAVIYEGINRVKQRGAKKIFVGSNQPFYISIGFSEEYSKEIWLKKIE
jgi:predicted N-acetyltransferase YhbS